MRFWTSVAVTSGYLALLTSALATPQPSDNTSPAPADNVFEKRQNVIITTGVRGGPVMSRLEVRDLRQNADQWNIYLLGLSRMYSLNQRDPLSYYQIAGIHGRPQVGWNGYQGVSNPAFPGFCTHVSNIFVSWHRPYLALYEQTVVNNAIAVASSFPQGQLRDRYMQAASTLRVPYWDWAATPPNGENVVPDFMVQPSINVISPENPNGWTTIRNPLYSYRFHPEPGSNPNDPNDLFYYPWTQMPETLRAPSSNDNPNAVSQNDVVIRNFNAGRSSLRSRLYTLLTQYDRYQSFSNSAWAAGGSNSDSLESVHDNVHGFVGSGQGHMSILDFSAFDPSFWLHHAMVDRIGALWQAINPNSYVEPAGQRGGTYWYNSGDVLNADSGLAPFLAPNGGLWSSNMVRTTEVFNYDYPGISQFTTPAQARAIVNQQYGTARDRLRDGVRPRVRVADPAGGSEMPTGSPNATSSTPSEPTGETDQVEKSVATSSDSLDYMAIIRAPKNGWSSSYFVYIFLGEPTVTDPKALVTDPAFVGLQSIVSRVNPVQGGNSTMAATRGANQSGHNVLIGSTIPLNDRLSDVPVITGFSPEIALFSEANEAAVTAYLEKMITWKVIDSTGEEVPFDKLPDLEISVVSQKVAPAQSADTFPKWIGQTRWLPSVTRNKIGGFRGLMSDRPATGFKYNVRPVSRRTRVTV